MRLFKLIIVCLLVTACTHPGSENPLLFEGAWVRAMPPGSMMTAGFGRMVNNGDVPIQISAISSPQFGDVSLHRTVLEEGVSRMKEVHDLGIAPGSELELAPGGYHLMLMKPTGDLAEWVEIDITLTDERQFRFTLPIERK